MMDVGLTGAENLNRQIAVLMGSGGKIADAEERGMLRFAAEMDKAVKLAMIRTPRQAEGRRPFGTKPGSKRLHFPSVEGNAPAKDSGSYQKSMRFWTSRIPGPGGSIAVESVNFVGVRYASVLEDEDRHNRPVWKPTYKALRERGRDLVVEELSKVVS